MHRDSKGRFTSIKRFMKRAIITLFILGLIGVGGYITIDTYRKQVYINQHLQPTLSTEPTKSELDAGIEQVKSRADFQVKMKQYETLQATNIFLNERKTKLQTQLNEVEANLSKVRGQEVSLQ